MSENREMKNLKSRKLYLQVYDEIKDYIEKNRLMPGDKLPSEMKMCEMLGVSRNVLREAIKSLEITGAVRSTPGVGIVIQEFNADFFLENLIYSVSDEDQLHKEIKTLRRVVEIGFAKEAFEQMNERNLALLKKNVDLMEELFKQIKQAQSTSFGVRFAEADATFHKILFSGVQNHILISIIHFFWASDRFYQMKTSYSNMALTVEKHQRIYNALKLQDYQKFISAMEFHFNVGYFHQEKETGIYDE